MDNVRTIYLDWNTGGIVRSDSGAYLARQYDHLSNLIVFRNAPGLENYYLIVEMKEGEDDLAARSMEPIMLPGPYWLVPNVYTQLVQPVTFQVCCKTESGDFEQHSAKFKLNVIESLNHDGAELDVDPSPMFDAYEDYVDEKVQELIDEAGGISIDTRAYVDQKITEMVAAAGEVIIDSTLSISGAAADAKATGDAISETNERLVQAIKGKDTLTQSGIIQGTYNRSGAVVSNSARIRNNGFIQVYAGQQIHFVPGSVTTQFLYGIYDTEKIFVEEKPWVSEEVNIPIVNDGYIIVVFANAGKTDITPADYDATLCVFSPISAELNNAEIAIDRIDKKVADIIVPEVRNGSVGNSGNLTAVTSTYVIPIKNRYKTMRVEYVGDRENITDYAFFYCFFHGAEDGMGTSAAFVSSSISKRQVNSNADTLIQIPYEEMVLSDYFGYEHFSVGLWAKNGNEWLPLRSVTDQYCLKITFSDTGGTGGAVDKETLNARHIEEDAGTALTLAHFSDLHADTGALSRIMEDIAQMGTAVDEIICTGDMVAGTATQISEWWPGDVLTVIGNHDAASYSAETGYDWAALSMADRDSYYIAPFISNWGGVVHTSGTSYYYKDYTAQKVRLIVLDAQLYITNGLEATTQTAWLANLLSGAISGNLDVIIAIHSPYRNAPVVPCTFSRYGRATMANVQDSFTPDAVVSAVTTAIGNGLNFVGYIVGHSHQDYVYKATEAQLGFCVTCANVATRAQWRGSDQNRDALSDAYNLVTIDTTNKLVKIVRGGGADIDDKMRTRKAICFDYSTGEKVGEVL